MAKQLFVATGSYEGIILGFNVNLNSANPAFALTFTEKTHTSSVKAVKLSGTVLLSGSSDENVHVFDIGKKRFLGSLHFPEGEIGAIEAFECDTSETSVAHANTSQNSKPAQFALVADGDLRVTVLRVRARRMAIGSIQTYKRAQKPGGARNQVSAPFSALSTHPTGKLVLAVSSSRKRLFTFSFNVKATIGDQKPLKLEHTLPLHREPISVRWNQSGAQYALALRAARLETAQGDELRVFNVADGCQCARVRVAARMTSFEWLAVNRLIVACADGNLRVYRIETTESASNADAQSEMENDKIATASVAECQWRVSESRIKALSVVDWDETSHSCMVVCVSSDGLVSLLRVTLPAEAEAQVSSVCSFKSVFRLTCVTAGVLHSGETVTVAEAEAEAESEELSAAVLHDAESQDANVVVDTVRHSIVELATTGKQRQSTRGGLQSQTHRGREAGNKRKMNTNRGATAKQGKGKPKANAAPRQTQLSKMEKKVRRWTAEDSSKPGKKEQQQNLTDNSQSKLKKKDKKPLDAKRAKSDST